MDTKDKWSEEVLLCGIDVPDGGEPIIVLGPKPLSTALGQYAVCDGQMEFAGCRYVYIVDCKGNILADKWI